MNRQKQAPATGNARVNMVVLQMEGDTAALAKGLGEIIATVQRSNGYVVGGVTPKPPAVLTATATSGAAGDENALPEPQMTLDEIQTPAPPAAAARPTRARPLPRPPRILDELNAHEEPGGFKSFVNGRNVDADNKKGLVAAVWLKDHGVTEFSIDHVNTCFSMVKWQMPGDPGSLLRNMARHKVGLIRHVAGKAGLYELTAKGLNEYAEIT